MQCHDLPKTEPREAVVAAQVFENPAPHEDVDGVEEVERGLERAGEGHLGFRVIVRRDERAGVGEELLAAALRGKDGSRTCACGDEQDAARHGTGVISTRDPAASTPGAQWVIMKRATT